MRVRDFEADTRYLLDRHRLHNRLLHGWGIVSGLRVEHHPDPDCQNEWVVIKAGLAIDCHGREVVVSQDIRWKVPLERYGSGGRRRPFLIGVRFCEQRVELVRVLYSEGHCEPGYTESNRLRDGVEIATARVHRRCWPVPDHPGDRHDHRDEDDPKPGTGQDEREQHRPVSGFDADCPCGDLVPLARIKPNQGRDGFEIDLEGRRYLPPPASRLTRIEHINWPHGGTVTHTYLEEVMRRQLRVTFSRPLHRQPEWAADDAAWRKGWRDDGCHERRDEATGLNAQTFVAQYVQSSDALEFLHGRRRVENDDRVAVLQLNKRPNDAIYYVTLQCDFILDRDGVPVDGNHLRGRMPTGNGAPGGAFQSWFRVASSRNERPF